MPSRLDPNSGRIAALQQLTLWADTIAKVDERGLGRNNRTAASKFFDQHCATAAHLE
jgi:hypothetical protein